MIGNVAEWVQDRYHGDYVGAPTDGSAWEDGAGDRVSRGGDFMDRAVNLGTTMRNAPSFSPHVTYGFRCAW